MSTAACHESVGTIMCIIHRVICHSDWFLLVISWFFVPCLGYKILWLLCNMLLLSVTSEQLSIVMDNRICGHNRCFTKYRHSIELIINMFDALLLYCLSDSSCLILCINIIATILKVRLASYFLFCLDYSINCRNQLHKSKRIFYLKKYSCFLVKLAQSFSAITNIIKTQIRATQKYINLQHSLLQQRIKWNLVHKEHTCNRSADVCKVVL